MEARSVVSGGRLSSLRRVIHSPLLVSDQQPVCEAAGQGEGAILWP